jgi:protein-L-isoaspartate(D-aspartate) O-methyltransferase
MLNVFKQRREAMVCSQLQARDITNQQVLAAFKKVPREKFIPASLQDQAYSDNPLPISKNQTISQPYVVAKMCQLLQLTGNEKVLDIGTGSGYQAAILSYLCQEVFTIETIESLAEEAKERLNKLGYTNVTVIQGDGRLGLSSEAPFDAIKSAAASSDIPEAWKEQLAIGGRIVLPLKIINGQKIIRVKKTNSGFEQESFGLVRFVPLV